MNKETNSEKISYGLGFFIIALFILLLRSRSRITRSKQQKTVQLVAGGNTVLDVFHLIFFLDHLSNFRGNKYWQLFCSSVKCISNRRAELYWALHELYALWKTGVCVCWCLFFFLVWIFCWLVGFFTHMDIEETS